MGKRLSVAAVAIVLAAGVAQIVRATPASGVLSGTVFARGSFTEPVDIKIKVGDGPKEVIHVPNAQETVVQQIVLAPGGQTGWHSHPGPVVVVVAKGELTLYSGEGSDCHAHTYTAGQAFVDSGQGHAHVAVNLSGTENVEVWATYFDVPPGGAFRLDAPAPGGCL
jgi:quercetin dioxygenase-like cupin family protein